MTTSHATIANAKGIHLRPSCLIAAVLVGYSGTVEVSRADGVRHIVSSTPLSVQSLALRQGESISVSVAGPDEAAICHQLCRLFSRSYDFK